jgi:hypothetical protein
MDTFGNWKQVIAFSSILLFLHAARHPAARAAGDGKDIGSLARSRGNGQGAGVTFCESCLTGPVPCGGTVTGSLAAGDCFFTDQSFFELYELIIPPGKLVDLRLSSAAFNCFLFVMDETCELVLVNDDCHGGTTDSCLLAMQLPGRYFVGVNSVAGGETGDYTLEVICSDNGVCACPAEPIVCGDTQGQLDPEDCPLPGDRFHDVLRFEVTASSLVNISVPDAAFTPALTVVDSTCSAVASPNFCPAGEPCLSLALEPGTYFFNVTSAEPDFLGDPRPYTIHVSCHDLALCRDCTVGALTCDSGTVSGNLPATTCTRPNGASVNLYQLDVPEFMEVSLSLGSAAFDPQLFILDRFCEPEASSEGCGLQAGEACLEFRPLAPGTYLVGASSAQPGGGGAYDLEMSCKPFSFCECDTRTIACGEQASGTLAPGDCVFDDGFSRTFLDTWKLELPRTQRVTVELSSSDFLPRLLVYDSTCGGMGTECFLSDPNLRCVLDLPPGTYYLGASSELPEVETGAYELRVSCADITFCRDCLIGPIACGRPVEGGLASPPCKIDEDHGFVDMYELDLPQATLVDIDLSAEVSTRLVLLDSECLPIDAMFCDDPGSTGSCLRRELPAGRFFIGANADSPEGIGPYTLSVKCADLQLPGDCNQDGTLNIADGICLLGFLFLGTPSELPCDSGLVTDPGNIRLLDFGGQGTLELSDAVASFLYLFSDSPPHPLGTACVPIAGCELKCDA